MIKAIIFDCFGVLYLDSHQSLSQKYPDLAQEIVDLGRQSDYGWIGKDEYLKALSGLTGEGIEELETFITSEHHLNTELVEYIRELKSTYRIGLLSNVGRGWLDAFFEGHQLDGLFEEVVASGEVGMMKPDREIYELMADRLGLSPTDCVMIDDIEGNTEGAKTAGMSAIRFLSNSQMRQELQKIL